MLYQVFSSTAAWAGALNHAAGRAPMPHIINVSLNLGGDAFCLGETALSQAHNDAYELGMLPINSGGNLGGHASNVNCTVEEPGSAIGVLTVNGHGNSWFGTETDVRTGAIYASGPRGGVSAAEGKWRTIVDLTAHGYRRKSFDLAGGYGTSSIPVLLAG